MRSVRQPVPSPNGGMRLPPKVGVGEEKETEIRDQWNTLENIEEEIEQEVGVHFKKPDFGYPGTITADQLTTVDTEEYTRLFTEHLAWFNYIKPIKARVDARLLQLHNERTDIEQAVRIEEKQKNAVRDKSTKVTLKDAVWNDARYKELTLESQRFEQKALILEALLEGIERNMFVISRNVTIRGQEIEKTRLEHSYTARPTGHRIPNWGGNR